MTMLRSKLVLGVIFHTLAITLIAPNVVWFYINRATYFETGVDKLSVGAMLTVFYMLTHGQGCVQGYRQAIATFMNYFLVLLFMVFESVINDLFFPRIVIVDPSALCVFYSVFSTIRYMGTTTTQ